MTETFIIPGISPEEQTAINTAAAMVAVLTDNYHRNVLPKLEALQVAFKAYPGLWSDTFYLPGSDQKIYFVWDGRTSVMKAGRNELGYPLTVLRTSQDPELEMAVAMIVTNIANAWTQYLDTLFRKGPYQK